MAFLKHKILFKFLIFTEMKKFIYSFAVIAALGLVACGGNKNEEAAAEEPVVEEAAAVVEETVTETPDSLNCCNGDSCTAETPAPEAAPAE